MITTLDSSMKPTRLTNSIICASKHWGQERNQKSALLFLSLLTFQTLAIKRPTIRIIPDAKAPPFRFGIIGSRAFRQTGMAFYNCKKTITLSTN